MCSDTDGKEGFTPTAGDVIHMISHRMKRQNPLEADEITLELTPVQKHTLGYILFASRGGEIYQRDIEEEFHIRRPTATGILQLLEKNGYIKRESVEKDARLKRIIPTDKAERIRSLIEKNNSRMNEKLVKGIPEKELKICIDVLWRMLNNLRETKPD